MSDLIEKELKKHRLYRNYNGYYKILRLHNSDPLIVENLINNLKNFRPYRDYFDILSISQNSIINDMIYKILFNQFKKDLFDMKNNKSISNLAKWLPRKNKNIDKKINFVTKFSMMLYPHLLRDSAEKQYRKRTSEMSKYLQVPEIYITSNNLDQLNTNKISHFCLKKHYKKLTGDEEIKQKLISSFINKYSVMDLETFMRNALMDSKTELEKQCLDQVWTKQKESFELLKYKNQNILLNLVDNKKKFVNIGIAIYVLDNGGKVIINSQQPYIHKDIEGSFTKRVNYLKMSSSSFNTLLIDEAKKLCENFIILDNQQQKNQITNNNFYLIKKYVLMILTMILFYVIYELI